MTNALKHAPASHIRVALETTDLGPQLQVTDNGPGFATSHAGAGLRGLHDRVESLGGHFDIDSTPRGTVLTASIPAEPV